MTVNFEKTNPLKEKKYLRIRDWMNINDHFLPGKRNAITDVPGVMVGHKTLFQGETIRTGVTVIRPHEEDIVKINCPAGCYIGNGYGKSIGTVQLQELGLLESYIGLTNTLAVAPVLQGLLNHHTASMGKNQISLNVVVGETNDGTLNDIRSFPIKPEHVLEAIDAFSEDVTEGSVGAGTGTICFGWKGGIGTSSRVIPGKAIGETEDYVVGALLQTNFGENLNIYGHAIPKIVPPELEGGGSCMIILATNAPMDERMLKRLCKRGIAGMVASGSFLGNSSGDICIAFSNCEKNRVPSHSAKKRMVEVLSDDQMNPFFEATVEAVREAIYNSLTMASTVRGVNGHSAVGINLENYRSILPLTR